MHNYSSIQKFLHDFILKKKFINKSLFELEKIIFSKNLEIKNKSHIFTCRTEVEINIFPKTKHMTL